MRMPENYPLKPGEVAIRGQKSTSWGGGFAGQKLWSWVFVNKWLQPSPSPVGLQSAVSPVGSISPL